MKLSGHSSHMTRVYNNFSFFVRPRQNNKHDVESVRHGLNNDGRAMLTLCSERQESLKASTTQQLIGKKRKEATTESRVHRKQSLEAKNSCKSWSENEVFDLVDTRKLRVRNWVTGRWVLTIKGDKEGNFLKTKALRGRSGATIF